MTINTNEIRRALRGHLLDLGSPPLPDPDLCVWGNRPAEKRPADDEWWMREDFLPGAETPLWHVHNYTGLVQWSLFCPGGGGTREIEDLADTIKGQFKPGRHARALVSIDRSEVGPGRQDGNWFMVPVTVYWRVTRPP